ncbi:MAG: hypothetical protein WCV99_16900 [Sterolibacterium sp.]|jgi:hypothetical protein
MDIPARLAKQMGGWENLARALHSVFLEQQEVQPKQQRVTRKKKYDAEWFYTVLLLMEGKVQGRGGRDTERCVIRQNIRKLYLNGKIPPGPAALEQKAQLVAKRLSEARSRWGYALQGSVRGAINDALQAQDEIDNLDWTKLHPARTKEPDKK